jgi:hypothetical protein
MRDDHVHVKSRTALFNANGHRRGAGGLPLLDAKYSAMDDRL